MPRPYRPRRPPPTVDDTDAATALRIWIDAFAPAERQKGYRYFQDRRVSHLIRESDFKISAAVRGSRNYGTELERDGHSWISSCTCPVGEFCKHSIALAYAWIEHLAAAPDDQHPVAAAAASRESLRPELEATLARQLGRPLASAESAFLGTLCSIFENFRQSGILFASDVARLGFQTDELRRGPFQPVYRDWWTQPPADPLALWQFVAYDVVSSGLDIPAWLRPVTDTSGIAASIQARRHREQLERWQDRLRAVAHHQIQQTSAAPRASAVAPLDLRLRLGDSAWVLEGRSDPAASWSPLPRTFLEKQAQAGSAGLARLEATPAVYAFLAVCLEIWAAHYRLVLGPEDRLGRHLLLRLLQHPLARTRIVDAAGAPIRFSPTPLVRRLAPAPDRADHFILGLELPDGSPLPPRAAHLSGTPDCYLLDGTVYPGPPPLDGDSAAAALIPAAIVEDAETLQLLRRLGTRLPPELQSRFVEIPLRARIVAHLATDYADREHLTLNLEACTDRPAAHFTWKPSGWLADQTVETAAERPELADKVLTFDFALPDRAAALLREFKVQYTPETQCWSRRLTRTFPEEFLAWRESLPPEIEVLAHGELASLLGATVRARVDFALLESSGHRDWFDLSLALKPEDTTLTPAEIALLLKARGKLVRLPGKGWRRLAVEIDAAPAAALEAAGFDSAAIAASALAGEKHRFHALQLAQGAVAEHLPERDSARLRERASALARPTPPAVPAGLRAELRPYQREGFEFLAFLSANDLGGILADDMGLGKTVQTLAWLLWLADGMPAGRRLRTLVVCPKSVIGNWETETARFAPSLSVRRFDPDAMDPPAGTEPPHLTVANYTQLRLGAAWFAAQTWDAVVLDEGQFVKNPGSKVAQTARALRTPHRLILTGTPIENRLLDLWSLFAFALPGLLGTAASFKRHYDDDNPLALPRLRARVRHFLLRRTKAQVAADLPPRTEEDIVVELEGDQRKLYDAELKRARAALLKVETARDFDRARFNILASLLRLRQICCHPALIDPAHAAAPSAKLEALLEHLEELRAEGHQVLVFSQFVTMLERIRDQLAAAGIGHLLLTGQTEDRDALVREFQSDRSRTVFLLSLKAAGFGLNLTAASYVVLYDPWWNPAVEAQAIDRTHRIGQTVPVNAYRLIARDTVEEKIRLLQREKSALAGAVVQEESLAQLLDLDSLRRILG